MDPRLIPHLDALSLVPEHHLHFGRNPELPAQDTLDFPALESWSHDLSGNAWDPDSLSNFWFELVNGAYGDVYRAKALMKLPDGQAFFFNWMVSQKGSQFLPLETIAPPHGRPKTSLAVGGARQGARPARDGIHDQRLPAERFHA